MRKIEDYNCSKLGFRLMFLRKHINSKKII